MLELDFHQLVAALERCKAEQEMVLVAIDGPGGAGKSTLAARIGKALNATLIEGDDFYRVLSPDERWALDAEGGSARYFDWQRLRDQVLLPLRAGRAARYERFDWKREQLGAMLEVQAQGVILVEGVYTFRSELRSFYDWSMLVQAPREQRLARVRARQENEEAWIERWDAAEQWYFTHLFEQRGLNAVISSGSEL